MIISYLKRGAYNSFFFALSSTIVRAVNFLFLPYILTHLSLEEFGIWDFYQLFFSYGTLLMTSCAATGMIRFYLLYQDDEIKQRQSIGNSFISGAVAAVLCPIITLLSYNYALLSTSSPEYLFIGSFSISFFTLFSLVLAYMRMKENVVWYLTLFCLQNIIATFLTLYGISIGYHIKALLYANIVSFILFVPFFFTIWFRHRIYSFALFKEQFSYSFPLLIYSLLYSSLLGSDRWFIQHYHGYELLGTYALLWRFGALFQFAVISLMDTWPLLVFNAQKEKNERALIGQLTKIFCLIITSIGIVSILCSHIAISYFLPGKYRFLKVYLPSFFIPLVALELARVLQVGFSLATRTNYIPIIAAGIIPIQIFFLYLTTSLGIWGIFSANTISFALYCCASSYLGNKTYPTNFSRLAIIKICTAFCICSIGLQVCAFYSLPIYSLIVVSLFWPIFILSFGIIEMSERIKIGILTRRFALKFLKFLFPPKNKPLFGLTKVLYLRTDICSQELTAGGSVAHTLGVINGLKTLKIDLTIASAAMKTILESHYSKEFINLKMWPLFFLFRWKLGYCRWRLESFFSTFIFAFKLKFLFRTHYYDALYQRYSLLNATGAILSVRYTVPLILEYNGSEVWQFDQLASKKWFKFNWLAKLIEEINLDYAQTIIVVSQALNDDLVNKGINPSKILINPNGVDTSLYNPQKLIEKRNQIRKQLRIDDKFVFGFVGTFSFWHGIETIAQMIPEVVKRAPNVHFLLIGDGMLKPYLENEIQQANISSRVTLTGLVDAQTAREYLAACDAFLCPTQPMPDGSRFFGSPTKMFEYLSMGKPIIASNLEQLKELMNPSLINPPLSSSIQLEGRLGILVDPDNIDGFIDAAIILAKSSLNDIDAMGKNNRNKAINSYSWKNHVDKIVKFISQSDEVYQQH